VLLDWLTTEGNYMAYCGNKKYNQTGKIKTDFQKEIDNLIDKKLGVRKGIKAVENKIGHLERNFREANDWLNNTGAGLQTPGDINEYFCKKFPLYNILQRIMGDRPNARPLATSDDISGYDNSEVSSDETSDGNNSSGDDMDPSCHGESIGGHGGDKVSGHGKSIG
jgi:hypothetical protein